MKKFLLLMLVLGLATSAQAGLIFTVNGQPQPNTVYLMPSEVIELDLEISDGGSVLAYTLDYVLSNDQARLIYDGASGDYPDIDYDMTDIHFPTDFDMMPKVVEEVSGPQLVEITAGQVFSDPVQGPAVLMVELYLHCLDTTDVVLEIISQGSEIDDVYIPPGTLLHTLYIVQIPEPMTIALLGLGGLFALRKRK
jgi:hypothetical protein